MPREAEPSLNEREFLRQALRENIRLDGRSFDAFRDLELTFGDEYGVVDVQLGKTRYIYPLELPPCTLLLTHNSQSPRPRLSRSHNTLPGPQIRRHLHNLHRALPPRLTSLRSRPPDGDRSPALAHPGKDDPSLWCPRYRIAVHNRRRQMLCAAR